MKASDSDTDELPVAAMPESADGPQEPQGRTPSLDRRTVRDNLRKARRVRRLYALGGLAVLAAFLGATVVVVDMVR